MKIYNIDNYKFVIKKETKKFIWDVNDLQDNELDVILEDFHYLVKKISTRFGLLNILNIEEIEYINVHDKKIARLILFYNFLIKILNKNDKYISWSGCRRVVEYNVFFYFDLIYKLSLFEKFVNYFLIFKRRFGKVLVATFIDAFIRNKKFSYKKKVIMISINDPKYFDITVTIAKHWIIKDKNNEILFISNKKYKKIISDFYIVPFSKLYRYNKNYKLISNKLNFFLNEISKLIIQSENNVYNKLIKNMVYLHSFKISNLCENIDNLLEKYKPSAFFSSLYVGKIDKAVIAVCKNKKINVYGMKRGMCNDSIELDMFNGDILFVKSKHDKDKFIERGISLKKINILGTPIYDKLVCKINEKEIIRQSFIEENKITDDIKTILCYLPQPYWGWFNYNKKLKEINILIKCAKKTKCFLLVKAHPNETDLQLYHERANYYNFNSYIIKKDNIVNSLLASDIAITKTSAAGLDALIIGLPLFVLNIERKFDETNNMFIEHNLATIINNENDLIKKINNNLKTNYCKKGKSIEYFVGKLDCKSSHRIVDTIYNDIIHENK